MGESEDSPPPSRFVPPGLGVPGTRAPVAPPMAAPGMSAAPRSTPARAAPADDGSAAAGVGALLAAAGLFGFQLFAPLRVGSGPFFHTSSVWWSRGWAVNMIVILLLAVCGL